jgi:hypothetical protein
MSLAPCSSGAVALARAAEAADTQFAPRLRAELGRYTVSGPTLVLDVTQSEGERPLGQVTFVAPAPGLALPPPGQRIGEAAAAVAPTAVAGGAPVVLGGDLRTIAPPAGCVTGAKGALRATLGAVAPGGSPVRRLTVTVLVHEQRGSTRLTACLPGPAELAGRSAVRRLSLRIERGARTPLRRHAVWRGLFTPADAGDGDTARRATTESRVIVSAGSFVTLKLNGKASVAPKSLLSLGGTLALGDQAAGKRVRLLSGTSVEALRVRARTRVGRLGTFRLRVRAPAERGTLVLQARAPSRQVPCRGLSADAPAGCTSATIAGVSSPVLRLRIR